MSYSADANLLFGILALQMDFINRDQLILGMQEWVLEKSVPLAEHLERRGAISPSRRHLIEPLVAEHVRQHCGDPGKSLQLLSSVDSIRDALSVIKDPEVAHSLQQLPERGGKSIATLIPETTSSGKSMRFQIIRPHARGGLGEVFVAKDAELGREVALKEIQLRFAHDAESRVRFTREAEITGGLEHPGIVPVYGLGSYPDGRPFYAMRFIRGQSLHDAIQQFISNPAESTVDSEKNLSLRRLLQRFIDVCEAIHYAHSRGVLHRDLKPGNVMLGRYGETLVVDWGLARTLGESSVSGNNESSTHEPAGLPESALQPSSSLDSEPTKMGSVLGTPSYMSPEQATGRLDLLSPASDVFSLGAVLYELLTGRRPYVPEGDQSALELAQQVRYPAPRTVNPRIPRALAAICLKAMAAQREQRYATARDLASDVERYLADEPIAAAPESPVDKLRRWSRKNRQWVLAGAAALVIVVITVLIAYVREAGLSASNAALARKESQARKSAQEASLRETEVRKDVERKNRSLQAALASNSFTSGLSALTIGRMNEGFCDLRRGWALSKSEAPPSSPYQQVLLHRITQGGRSSGLTLRHSKAIASVAFHPAGKLVATACQKGEVRLWHALTGEAVGSTMPHEKAVHQLLFHSDGTRLFSTSGDGTSQIWQVPEGVPLGSPMRHTAAVTCVSLSENSDLLATGSRDHCVRFWNAKTGEQTHEPLQFDEVIASLALSPSGDRIVIATGASAQVFAVPTLKKIGQAVKHADRIIKVSFNPRGQDFLSASADFTARIWNTETGEPLNLDPMRHESPVTLATYCPLGRLAATASGSKVAIWDAQIVAPLGEPLQNRSEVSAIAFQPGGPLLACGCSDGSVRMWHVFTGKPVGESMFHAGPVRAISFNSGGDILLTGSDDRTARVWQVHDGLPNLIPSKNDPKEILDAISGKASQIDPIQITEEITARQRGDVTSSPVVSTQLCRRGPLTLIRRSDNVCILWHLDTKTAQGEALLHTSLPVAADFSPDGKLVATATEGGVVQLWDTQTGISLSTLAVTGKILKSIVFVRDGQALAGQTDKDELLLWKTPAPVVPEQLISYFEQQIGSELYETGKAIPIAYEEGLARRALFFRDSHSWTDAVKQDTAAFQEMFHRRGLIENLESRDFAGTWHHLAHSSSVKAFIDEQICIDTMKQNPSCASLLVKAWAGKQEEVVALVRELEFKRRLGTTRRQWKALLREIRLSIPESYWTRDSFLSGFANSLEEYARNDQNPEPEPASTLSRWEIWYLDSERRARTQAFDGSEPRIPKIPAGTLLHLQSLDEGQSMVAGVGQGSFKVWKLNPSDKGEPELLVTLPRPPADLAVNGNGNRFAVSQPLPSLVRELALFDRQAKKSQIALRAHHPAWLNDGSMLYMLNVGGSRWMSDNWRLALADAQGSIRTQFKLPIHRTSSISPCPSPDGSFIAFTMRGDDGTRQIGLTSPDGQAIRQVTWSGTDSGLPVVSPDGRYVAYIQDRSDRDDLRIVDLETGSDFIAAQNAYQVRPAWRQRQE